VAALERRHGIAFESYFADALERLKPLEADGLVRLEPGRIRVTSQGRLLLRNIAMCFDRYLPPPDVDTVARFSRAI
jgi:oxygen-independent coproporphyrinogen-3 oxidase